MGGGQRQRRRRGRGGADTPCPSHADVFSEVPFHADVNIALVGKIGSGKSATGKEEFVSKRSYRGVTKTCQKRSKAFQVGRGARTLNVIDTPGSEEDVQDKMKPYLRLCKQPSSPMALQAIREMVQVNGLFDVESTAEDFQKEIAQCMDTAKQGIQAILLVFSAAYRFSCEDQNTIESIKLFFGNKILDHAILVFTHGDEAGGMIGWNEMLSDGAPPCLQDMLKLFENRVVLFDNKTSDAELRQLQINSLFDALHFVLSVNDGRLFSNEMFMHIQEAHQTFKSKRETSDEYLMHITMMVEEKLNSATERMKKQLQKEQKDRQDAENKLADQIRSLQESLEKAENDRKVAQERLEKAEYDRMVSVEENEKLKKEENEKLNKEPSSSSSSNSNCVIL